MTLTLDSLPDELLSHILFLTLGHPTPYCLEYCTWLHGRPNFEDSPLADVFNIEDPSTAPGRRPGAPLHPSQLPHVLDWIAVTHTNRRFQRLGIPLFWATRTVAMSDGLPLLLARGELASLMSRGDQALALRCMREVLVFGVSLTSPAPYVGLARVLRELPGLRRFVVCFGVQVGQGARPVVESVERTLEDVDDRRGGTMVMPAGLRELLVDTGVNAGLEFGVALCRIWSWKYAESMLAENVYPLLRFRARLLEKERENALKMS